MGIKKIILETALLWGLFLTDCRKSIEPIILPVSQEPLKKTLVDSRDGKIYQTVKIGNQWWMAENLNYGTMINSTTGDYQQTNNEIAEKYCYNNDAYNCTNYGGLYEWDEAMNYAPSDSFNPGTTQGICPIGWHLPTEEEWKTLEIYLGMSQADINAKKTYRGTNQGSKLAGNASMWADGDLKSNVVFGASGFMGLPGGNRHSYDGMFSGLSYHGSFLSATETGAGGAWGRILSADKTGVFRDSNGKIYGLSVRCIKN